MSAPSITVRTADGEDIGRVEALLEANDLPYQDVRAKPECFFVASSDAEVIGVGGVETYGSSGLLRSLAIEESSRGRGYGTTVREALEEYARTNGVATLYVLTTTASAFFRRSGYEGIARENVPSSIQRTTEFTEFCPTSATCLKKELR